MGNKVILAAIKQALSTATEYSLHVNYDSEGNPVLKVAPATKFITDSRTES